MKRLVLFLCFLAAITVLVMASCSDKNSQEACNYDTTMALDNGNYDAVLASPCADALQLGAANFGKAGFSATEVINRFVDAKNNPSSDSDIRLYMSQMIGIVSDATLGYLDNSHNEYVTVPAGDSRYQNAQFSLSLVDAIRGLSLLKFISESSIGTMNDSCDANNNTKPDDLDATSCSLYVSSGLTCTAPTLTVGGTVTVASDTPNLTFSSVTGTYRGLVIAVAGTGTNISGCPAPNEYKKLLVQSGATDYVAVATSMTLCRASDGNDWPCPLMQNGQPMDLVAAIDANLTSSVSALQSSTTGSSDVSDSITQIKTDACPAGTCTSADIADYLQKY
ncbi:MAG: hypothetical protein OEW15_08555 [Nitrospirota bacterium]|nr:hypothetical protein [Nitrospirota bacterium]